MQGQKLGRKGSPERCSGLSRRLVPEDSAASTTAKQRHIAVAIRLRPIQQAERQRDEWGSAWTARRKCIVDEQSGQEYPFDHVFGPQADTRELYEACVSDVISSFCDGVSGAIFAYGQTASGKTFTMHGEASRGIGGVVQLAADDIFRHIQQRSEREFVMSAAYLEIYNEQVWDLRGDGLTQVRICDDHRGETKLDGLALTKVSTPKDIYAVLHDGNRKRHVSNNGVNERSSRSHTVLRIRLESRATNATSIRSCWSVLDLVDLAGSEGLRHTEAAGIRRREGKNINQSLLVLSQVISALSDNSHRGQTQNISFRGSKLTRILQGSIAGNSQTVVICAASPAVSNRSETRSTLDFAKNAMHVRKKVHANVITEDRSVYRQEQETRAPPPRANEQRRPEAPFQPSLNLASRPAQAATAQHGESSELDSSSANASLRQLEAAQKFSNAPTRGRARMAAVATPQKRPRSPSAADGGPEAQGLPMLKDGSVNTGKGPQRGAVRAGVASRRYLSAELDRRRILEPEARDARAGVERSYSARHVKSASPVSSATLGLFRASPNECHSTRLRSRSPRADRNRWLDKERVSEHSAPSHDTGGGNGNALVPVARPNSGPMELLTELVSRLRQAAGWPAKSNLPVRGGDGNVLRDMLLEANTLAADCADRASSLSLEAPPPGRTFGTHNDRDRSEAMRRCGAAGARGAEAVSMLSDNSSFARQDVNSQRASLEIGTHSDRGEVMRRCGAAGTRGAEAVSMLSDSSSLTRRQDMNSQVAGLEIGAHDDRCEAMRRCGAPGARGAESVSMLRDSSSSTRPQDVNRHAAGVGNEVNRLDDDVRRKNNEVGASLAKLACEQDLLVEKRFREPVEPWQNRAPISPVRSHLSTGAKVHYNSCDELGKDHPRSSLSSYSGRGFSTCRDQAEVDLEVDKVLQQWVSGRSRSDETSKCRAESLHTGDTFSASAGELAVTGDPADCGDASQDCIRSTRRRLSQSFESAADAGGCSHDESRVRDGNEPSTGKTAEVDVKPVEAVEQSQGLAHRKGARLAASIARQEVRSAHLDTELATAEARHAAMEAEVAAEGERSSCPGSVFFKGGPPAYSSEEQRAKDASVQPQDLPMSDSYQQGSHPPSSSSVQQWSAQQGLTQEATLSGVQRERVSTRSHLDEVRQEISRSRPEIFNTDDREKQSKQEAVADAETEKWRAHAKELELELAAMRRQANAPAHKAPDAAHVPTPAAPRIEPAHAKVPLQDVAEPAPASGGHRRFPAMAPGRPEGRRQIMGRPTGVSGDGACNQQ